MCPLACPFVRLCSLSHRTRLWLLFAFCILMELAGLFMQHVMKLEPCPMCILQRYAFLLTGLAALVGALHTHLGRPGKCALTVWWVLSLLFTLAGLGVASWQSWIQRFPPSISTCGPDAFDMLGVLPFTDILPMIFSGSGSCENIEWTLFGLSIANYALLAFLALAAWCIMGIVRARRDACASPASAP